MHKPTPARQRALLIGVDQYQPRDRRGRILPWPDEPEGPYPDLHTALDIAALARALQSRLGFAPERIQRLQGRPATTRAALLGALDRLAQTATPGETIFLHYSGHGDRNEEEDRECLVPSDWYHDVRHWRQISGAELNERITAIQRAIGPTGSLTVSFDCCHSGLLLTRGQSARVRGRNPHILRPGARRSEPTEPPTRLVLADAAAYTAIFACRFDESASELLPDEARRIDGGSLQAAMGRLSYLLARACLAAPDGATWRDIFEFVRARMARHFSDQHPESFGNLERALTGALAPLRQSYVPVEFAAPEDEPGARRILKLRAGAVHGVSQGSVYALYPAGTRNFESARPFGQAMVRQVRAAESELTLVGGGDPARDRRLPAARALEREHAFGADLLRVAVSALSGLPGTDAIRRAVDRKAARAQLAVSESSATLRFVPVADVPAQWRRGEVFDACVDPAFALVRPGTLPAYFVGRADTEAQVAQTLEKAALYYLLLTLSGNEAAGWPRRTPILEEGVRIAVRARPCQAEVPDPRAPEQATFVRLLDEDRPRWLAGREYFRLEIANIGDVPAYLTLLNFPPTGGVHLLERPRRPLLPMALRDRPRPFLSEMFLVDEAPGTDLYRVLALPVDADLSPVVGRTRGKSAHPLAQLLRDTALGQGSRGRRTLPAREFGSATVALEVVAR